MKTVPLLAAIFLGVFLSDADAQDLRPAAPTVRADARLAPPTGRIDMVLDSDIFQRIPASCDTFSGARHID